jgi:hypothetical protein
MEVQSPAGFVDFNEQHKSIIEIRQDFFRHS